MTRTPAAARIRALAAVVDQHAAGVTAGAPDAVHDLRVACRRLETALRLWGRGAAARDARRESRALRRAVGSTREAEALRDMLAARWVARSSVPAAERRAWRALLEPACAPPALLPASRTRLAVAVEAAASRIESRGVRAGRTRTRLARWRNAARKRLTTSLLQDGDPAHHRARLAIKRWRYAEESLAGAGRPRSPRIEALRRWQRELGAMHDLASLAGFVLARGEAGRPLVLEIDRRRLARLERLRRRAAREPSRPRKQPAPH